MVKPSGPAPVLLTFAHPDPTPSRLPDIQPSDIDDEVWKFLLVVEATGGFARATKILWGVGTVPMTRVPSSMH